MTTAKSFGDRLRCHRAVLGLSQLDVAVEAGISPRHLSFMETGRANPSRAMVLRLAEQLRLPLREQNALLLAAGFAPAFAQHDLDEPALAAIRAAAVRVLEEHEPFPAVALDRRRNVVLSNRAASRLVAGVGPIVLGPPMNIYRLLLHPEGLARRIVGFRAYSRHLLVRLQRDAELSGDEELHTLFEEVGRYPGIGSPAAQAPTLGDAALSLRLRDEGGELAFFTTLATFGTPFDVTVSELVIESLFPADDRTRTRLHYLGGK